MRRLLPILLIVPRLAFAQVPQERPVQHLPAGFVAEIVDGVSRVQNYYPAGQTARSWQQRIATTLLAVRGVSPAMLLGRLADRWQAGCPGAAPAHVQPVPDGPHAAAQVELDCAMAPGGGGPEHSWVRAVAAGNTVFVSDYTFHDEPDGAERRQALDYLLSVGLAP